MLTRVLAVALAVFAATVPLPARQSGAAPNLLDALWRSVNPQEAAAKATRLATTGVNFDTVWTQLKAGRAYGKEPVGESTLRYPFRGDVQFENTVEVPKEYDPSRRWALRVQLHGGIGRPVPNATRPEATPQTRNRIPGEPQIYIYPSGWNDAQWWDTAQVENILRTVDAVKRRYNVDESRVYLTGISDGGTGTYYMAMRENTPWASFLPLNGSIAVLRNRATGADGDLFGNNLVNKPLYVVNGRTDQLYPVHDVEPHIRWFTAMGVTHVFSPQDEGHNTNWWPTERAPYERFVTAHPRQAHPARLSWETERVDRSNRVHWLVIDRLGTGAADTKLEATGFFPRTIRSGRVDVARKGNTFEAQSRGVKVFRLLLSPDAVDFSKPVTVMLNGRQVFQGPVTKDPAVLLSWAARDNDRTMLYGAELTIDVP